MCDGSAHLGRATSCTQCLRRTDAWWRRMFPGRDGTSSRDTGTPPHPPWLDGASRSVDIICWGSGPPVEQFSPIAGAPAFDVQVLLVMTSTGHPRGTQPGVDDPVTDPALDVRTGTACPPEHPAGCSGAAWPARSALCLPARHPLCRLPLRPGWPLALTGWRTATIKADRRIRQRRVCPARSSAAARR